EKRDVRELLIEVHAVLGPEVVLAEQETVIGGYHQGGVLPHVVPVEIIEKLAEEVVAHRNDSVVVGAQLLAFLRKLVDAAIARPVADRAVPAAVEPLLEAARRMEWLVGIERFDLQEPVVGVTVPIEKFEAVREALDCGEVLLFPDEFPVYDVLREVFAPLGRELAFVIHLAKPLPMRLHD